MPNRHRLHGGWARSRITCTRQASRIPRRVKDDLLTLNKVGWNVRLTCWLAYQPRLSPGATCQRCVKHSGVVAGPGKRLPSISKDIKERRPGHIRSGAA